MSYSAITIFRYRFVLVLWARNTEDAFLTIKIINLGCFFCFCVLVFFFYLILKIYGLEIVCSLFHFCWCWWIWISYSPEIFRSCVIQNAHTQVIEDVTGTSHESVNICLWGDAEWRGIGSRNWKYCSDPSSLRDCLHSSCLCFQCSVRNFLAPRPSCFQISFQSQCVYMV